jgi:hypothetical protein
VLGTPSPSVTPTNLLYNVVATPGALFRYWRQGQTGGRLALALIAGTLPGVIAGSVIRVELLPGDRPFDFVVAAVLLPLGLWLALTSIPRAREARPARAVPAPALIALAVAGGCVGGIYGIGDGSILAHRDSARHRRPGRRVHRRPHAAPPAGQGNPPGDGGPGDRHRRPLPVVRP